MWGAPAALGTVYPSVLTPACRSCDDPTQHQERGCPTRPQPEPYQGGNRGPMRITGDAVPRRDKDGGMTRPERVFVFQAPSSTPHGRPSPRRHWGGRYGASRLRDLRHCTRFLLSLQSCRASWRLWTCRDWMSAASWRQSRSTSKSIARRCCQACATGNDWNAGASLPSPMDDGRLLPRLLLRPTCGGRPPRKGTPRLGRDAFPARLAALGAALLAADAAERTECLQGGRVKLHLRVAHRRDFSMLQTSVLNREGPSRNGYA